MNCKSVLNAGSECFVITDISEAHISAVPFQCLVQSLQTDEGLTCTYQLRFFKDNNKGQELTTTYDTGGKTTVDREFSWRWTDDSKEALRLTFSDGKVKYFENVWVRDHYLSGKMDANNKKKKNSN